jgi:hypothetical protein
VPPPVALAEAGAWIGETSMPRCPSEAWTLPVLTQPVDTTRQTTPTPMPTRAVVTAVCRGLMVRQGEHDAASVINGMLIPSDKCGGP